MLRARFRASRCFDIFALCERRFLEALLNEKNQRKVKKKLTQEMKIDNLEKFAKTSLAAEVILDRLSQDSEDSKDRPKRNRTSDRK